MAKVYSPKKNGAREYFRQEFGVITDRIDVLRRKFIERDLTSAENEEFDRLYKQEGDWLDAHGIRYSPSIGWHFITAEFAAKAGCK